MTVLPALPPLPEHLTQRGGSPDLVGDELVGVIKAAIANHPRSLQKRIGPSEVGHPCPRRIGYTLAGHERVNPRDDTPWKPTIGTAVHAWLEEVFTRLGQGADHTRYLTEPRVDTGDLAGQAVTGTADLYDRVTATVVDWKLVGPSMLKTYRASGPGPQYRAQAHLYGRGFVRRGLPVDRVMVVFLPRNGELDDTYVWHEPYDEQVALDALQRADGVATALDALGSGAYAVLPTADAYCSSCPFWSPGSTDPARGCPGHEGGRANRPPADNSDPFG